MRLTKIPMYRMTVNSDRVLLSGVCGGAECGFVDDDDEEVEDFDFCLARNCARYSCPRR